MTIRWLAEIPPRDVLGRTETTASWKGVTSTAPSWWALIAADAFDWTLTANGLRPASRSDDRATRKRTCATASTSGKSERVFGSTTLQREGSPLSVMSYWSTMLLLFFTRSWAL